MTLSLPLRHGTGLLVLGSLNWNAADRTHRRQEIRPVQLLTPEGRETVAFFDNWGALGVSSVAWWESSPDDVYVSTGDDLRRVRLRTAKVECLPVEGIRDVHEMYMDNDTTLYISNTGNDEVVELDMESGRSKRIDLARYRARAVAMDGFQGGDGTPRDSFHCNQAFRDLRGHLCALVHHVAGWQAMRRVTDRLVKRQGDGGVIDLESGARHELGLAAPHSVRLVGDEHWVLDSGNGTIAIYGAAWDRKRTIRTAGWGRGAAWDADGDRFFVGISAIRRRYHDAVLLRSMRNMVRAFSRDGTLVGETVLEEMEQVNNVYVVSDDVISFLRNLR